MSRLIVPAIVLALAMVAGADSKAADELGGVWLPSSAELAGKPYPEQVRKSIKLVIEGEKYTVTVGQAVDRGTLKVNAAADPRQIDITGSEGPNKGKTILAIYQHDGDTLKICYDLSGKARPAEFKTKEGTLLYLVTYKREKP